jgi:hypothetical protein
MAEKKVTAKLELQGAAEIARDVDQSALAVGELKKETADMGAASKAAGGNGKALAADMQNLEHAVKKTNGEAARAKQELTGVGAAAQGAGRLLRGLRDAFGEVTVYTGAAYKALKTWMAGVNEARKAAAEDVVLRVAVQYVGETPEQAGERFERLAKKTERIALDLGLDPGEVQKAAAGVIAGPKDEKAILEGGLGSVGAMLGKETGMGSAGGMEYLKRSAKTWKTSYDESALKNNADILTRYSKAGGVSPQEFSGTMQKMGMTYASVGGRQEDAALLAASLMSVKPDRAGAALESFSDAIGAAGEDPKKRALMRRKGLDLFKNGKLLGVDDMQKKFDAFTKSEKNPLKRKAILTDLFGPAGADIGYLFESGAIGETRENAAKLPGTGVRTKAHKKTLDYWMARGKGALGEGVEDAFSGPEKLLARAGAWAVPNVVEPAREFLGSGAGQVVTNGVLLGGTVLAGGLGLNALRKAIKAKGGFGGMWKGVTEEAGSTAAGVGKGIAVAAMTGGRVQPVFVTNWPGNFGSGGGSSGAPDAENTPGLPKVGKGKALLAGGKKALSSIIAWGGSSVAGAGAGSILGASAIGLAGGAAVGYGINRLTMESRSENDAVRKSTIYDRLSGGGAETGEHQINMVQAGMAHVLAFFGDKNSARFLAEREELKKGGDYDSAAKAGDQAVAAARAQEEAARLANETSANLAAAITEFRQASAYIARGK